MVVKIASLLVQDNDVVCSNRIIKKEKENVSEKKI